MCYFYFGTTMDNTSGTYPAATAEEIRFYRLTEADFGTEVTTKISDGTFTEGYEVEDALQTGGFQVNTGVEYFDYPACQEDGSTPGLWYCQQYQRAVKQDEDGYPRFNKNRVQTWWHFIGFGEPVTLFQDPLDNLIFQQIDVAWKGSVALASSVAAIALASAIAF